MMKIALINPYPYYARGVEGIVYPPLGLLYLAGYAKARSLGKVKVIDANMLKMNNQDVLAEILGYKPDIIGISSNIVTHKSAIELMKLIKERGLRQPLLVGGPYSVLFPEKYLEYCDIVVNGEGEKIFSDILEAYKNKEDIFSVRGIFYKRDNLIVRNERAEFIDDLDTLPFPDYHSLTPGLPYYSKHSRVVKNIMAPILTSRGCPYQCTYCNKSVFGPKFRYRSPENIISEIKWLRENFEVDQIDILDDNFNLIPERAEQTLDMVSSMNLGLAISCHNGLRADKIDVALASKLKKSGVFKVGLGIETADYGLMASIKKSLDLNKVKGAVSLLRKEGITVHGYFILGLPGDTPSSMAQTIKFARELNPHFCNFTMCIPFPGTEIYNNIKQKGRFLVDMDNGISSGFFDGKVFFEAGETKAEEVAFYYKQAYRKFYFNVGKMLDILCNIKNLKEFLWILNMSFSVACNAIFSFNKNED